MRNKEITFYPTDWIEEQSLEEIKHELEKIDMKVVIDRTMSLKSNFGLFIGHQEGNKTELSKKSIIMLHDLGQAHNVWPNFWDKENWSNYEYGILPNDFWNNMYINYPNKERLPKYGCKVLGWPKSDKLINNFLTGYKRNHKKIRILYAPSWEYDNQQDKLIKAIVDLPIEIIIKQQYYEGMGHNERVKEMEKFHEGKWNNVYILDQKTKIFEVLEYADCVISDESSTLLEGAMVGCLPISIIDWKIPDTYPPRPPSVPFDYVVKIKQAYIRKYIEKISKKDFYSIQVNNYLNKFNVMPRNPGCAATKYKDLIIKLMETTNEK